jgi:phosphopantothenoylcysteine decarboxylase/phosphopantothenate--cysteine ligase
VSTPFEGKRVLLGVSGSIAAYKAADLASKLTQAGAIVDVLMTASASQFVTPMTFRTLTHRAVVTDLFDIGSPEAVEHVALATAADVLVVAPATAHMIAKLALGLADDPISVITLATTAPLVVAPAMDANMWENLAVQANVATLTERGVMVVGPGSGRLASGLQGWGRLAETTEIMGMMAQVLGRDGDLRGRSIVVSAGGTREPIDPVRVIANRSSGKMGYAVAEAARDRGACVTLVTASALPAPAGVGVVTVETTEEMRAAVFEACAQADALVMAAAVADYRPAAPSSQKIKKGPAGSSGPSSIELAQTADILAEAPKGIVRVGFAAESGDLLTNARAKLEGKRLDLIAANDITQEDAGFGSDTNRVTLLDATSAEELPVLPKYDVAMRILDRVAGLLAPRSMPTRA